MTKGTYHDEIISTLFLWSKIPLAYEKNWSNQDAAIEVISELLTLIQLL